MKNVVQFFNEVRLEFSKVVWPKFDEWVGSTIIVLLLVCVFAVYLGFIDFGLTRLAGLVFKTYGIY